MATSAKDQAELSLIWGLAKVDQKYGPSLITIVYNVVRKRPKLDTLKSRKEIWTHADMEEGNFIQPLSLSMFIVWKSDECIEIQKSY